VFVMRAPLRLFPLDQNAWRRLLFRRGRKNFPRAAFLGFALSFLGLVPLGHAAPAPDAKAADPLGPAFARRVAELAGPQGQPIQLDAGLTRAAARFVAQLAAREGPGTLEEARATLRAEGLAEAQVLPFSAAHPDPTQLAEQLADFARTAARPRGLTHVGVATLERGGGHHLVALFSRRVVYLQPLAEKAKSGVLTVRGKARGEVSALLVGPCPAGGEPCRKGVSALSVKRRGDALTVLVPLKKTGLYQFELVVTTERGPEIGALWTFAVGVPAGPIGVEAIEAGPATTERLIKLIEESRSAAEVGPLTIDDRLAAAAQKYAARICKTRIAAHVVGQEGPLERAKAEGYIGTLAENLAISDSLGQAHRQLLLSPGHRKNVLDPLSTSIGVGVVEVPKTPGVATAVCVVELYGR
jgi:hypothetical protein